MSVIKILVKINSTEIFPHFLPKFEITYFLDTVYFWKISNRKSGTLL